MADHSETRAVLWGRHDAELIRAQRLDAKAERRDKAAAQARADAAECRRRAGCIKQAAEVLGSIDGAGN